MIRLMGAVLAAAGCGWLGLRGAGALREQARGTWGMAAGLARCPGCWSGAPAGRRSRQKGF